MKCKLIKIIIVLCLLVYPVNISAQDEPEFFVFPHSTPNGMLLLIEGEMLHPNEANLTNNWIGYYIYKKAESDKDFIRITQKTLSRVGSLAELESKLGTSLDGLEVFVGLETKDQLWEQVVANGESIELLSVLLRPFREAMGKLLWDYDVIEGKTYEYYLTKVDINGKESDPSITVSMPYGVPPIPLLGPVDVQVNQVKKNIVISWKPNQADSGAFSYSVYRSVDPTASYIRLNMEPLLTIGNQDSDTINSFIDTTARSGRTYYYTVVSEDYGSNISSKDSYVKITYEDLEPPMAPQNVFTSSVALGLEITWDLVTEEGIAGYNIYRSNNADSNYVKINEIILPNTIGYFIDKSVTISDQYYYRVSAIDLSGNESDGSARSVYLYQNKQTPMPPQNVKAESRKNGIYIYWDASDELDIRGYYVYRADKYGDELNQVSPLIGKDTLFYFDNDEYLSPRGRYYYVVQAYNYTGIFGQYSLPVVASPVTNLGPDAPLSFYGYQDAFGIRLFWSPPENNLIAGYNVYRAKEGDSLDWIKLSNRPVPRNVGEYLDTTAELSTAYVYHLKAVNDQNIEGGRSHIIPLMQFSPAPQAPGNVRVERIENGLKVLWNKSLDQNIAGYRVYRRTDDQSLAVIHTGDLPSDILFLQDENLPLKIRYYYSVSAVSKDGQEGFRSAEIEYYVE